MDAIRIQGRRSRGHVDCGKAVAQGIWLGSANGLATRLKFRKAELLDVSPKRGAEPSMVQHAGARYLIAVCSRR